MGDPCHLETPFLTSTLFSYLAGWLKGEALVIIGEGPKAAKKSICDSACLVNSKSHGHSNTP